MTQTVTLQVAEVSDTSLAAEVPPNSAPAFAFTPHRATFEKPVTITLPAPEGANRVYRLDDENDTTWEEVPAVAFVNGKVTFETSHFCIYVAVRRVDANGTGGSSGASTNVGGNLTQGGTSSIGGRSSGGNSATNGGRESTSGGAASSTGGTATGGVATGGVATGGVATGGVATGGVATGGVATGGVATGGVATGGVATGGKTAGTAGASGNTSGVGTKFCSAIDPPPSTCYSVGKSACSTSIAACCGNPMCDFGLTCTLANVHSETACLSDGGSEARALYNTVKQCLVAAQAQCPFPSPTL